MRLFAISDLHLSLSADKPMDIFPGWGNYTERLLENWQKTVNNDDTVVIAGDVSWGISLEESLEDFKFINSLNGRKILLKGNHDYWWSTASKLEKYFVDNGIDSISILHNNCFTDGNIGICGTRGWVYDGTGQKDEKIIARECGRLERSLLLAENAGLTPVVFLHYPPAYGEYSCDEIVAVIKAHNIKKVYYGHIHGSGIYSALPEYEGINLKLLSADCIDFTPAFICECRNFELLKQL